MSESIVLLMYGNALSSRNSYTHHFNDEYTVKHDISIRLYH